LTGQSHLTNLKQLTFGGQNAEAYWSPDGKRLIFQSTRDGRMFLRAARTRPKQAPLSYRTDGWIHCEDRNHKEGSQMNHSMGNGAVDFE
jgi:dipeptidyl aminopeptidase/acylaminoacyl peptidase